MEDSDLEQDVLVDEAVTIEELLLQNLSKRIDLISKQREGMETKRAVQEKEVEELCLAERGLDQAMIQHLTLQQELELQLRRTEEKLSRNNLIFPDDASFEEKEVQDGIQLPNAEIEDHIDEPEAKKWGSFLDEELDSHNLVKTVPLLSINIDHQTEAERNDSDEDLPLVIHETGLEERGEGSDLGVAMENDQDLLPTAKRRRLQPDSENDTFSGHLKNPFLNDKGSLSSSFLAARTDDVFLNFCKFLDGTQLSRLMNLITKDHASMDSQYSDGKHRREALFHSCLLPFGLLWKDADNSKIVSSEGDQLDPDKPLCPYELAGVCADPYCVFQHLKEREVESKELVKEALTLPKLKLPQPAESDAKKGIFVLDDKELLPQEARLDDSTSSDSNGISQAQSSASNSEEANFETGEEKEGENKLTDSPMDFDEDFVSLLIAPESSKYLNESKENKDNVSIEEPNMWWMNEDDKERVKKAWRQERIQISIIDWIHMLFDIRVDGNNISFNIVTFDEKNVSKFICWLGRFSDAAKIAIHSGRYDIAHSVLSSIKKASGGVDSFPVKGLHQFYSNLFNHTLKVNINQKLLTVLSLELQLLLSCVSEFLFLFQNHRSVINNKFWREILLLLITTTAKRKPGTASSLTDRIKQKYFHLSPVAISKILSLLNVCNQFEQCSAAPGEKTQENPSVDQITEITRLREIKYKAEKSQSFGEKLQTVLDIALTVLKVTIDLSVMTRAVVTKLDSALDMVCYWIYHFYEPQLQLLITPLLSLHISLLIVLKRYDKAQNTLELYLNTNYSLYSLSDVLWSQLVVLRSNLKISMLSNEIGPQGIAQVVSSYDIRLNFVSLPGDRNLWKPFLGNECNRGEVQKGRKWLNKLRVPVAFFVSKATTRSPDSDGNILINLSLESLPLTTGQYPGKLITLSSLAFPRILMHGGFLVRTLNLGNCQICTLPSIFGQHFPNLQVRGIILFRALV